MNPILITFSILATAFVAKGDEHAHYSNELVYTEQHQEDPGLYPPNYQFQPEGYGNQGVTRQDFDPSFLVPAGAVGILAVGVALVGGAYVVGEADRRNNRLNAGCNGVSAIAAINTIDAGPAMAVIEALLFSTPTRITTYNNWISSVTAGINGITSAAKTNGCPS